MKNRDIIVIAHNLRSCHNVGSLLRTADGIGASVILTGYTPHPEVPHDTRLPHEIYKISKRINKISLNAEHSVDWRYHESLKEILDELRNDGYEIFALEQTSQAVELPSLKSGSKVAFIVGREVDGIEEEVLQSVPQHVYIPMFGAKESFNVVQAAAMALYHLRFNS